MSQEDQAILLAKVLLAQSEAKRQVACYGVRVHRLELAAQAAKAAVEKDEYSASPIEKLEYPDHEDAVSLVQEYRKWAEELAAKEADEKAIRGD